MLRVLIWWYMLVGSFVDHLIHPMTYTAPNGELKHLTSGDKLRVTAIVLSALTLTVIEALYSSRSLKTNFVSIGVIDVVVFYLVTAAMKRKSRDSSSSQEANHRISHDPKGRELGDSSKIEKQVQMGDNQALAPPRIDAQKPPPGPVVEEAKKPPGVSSSAPEETHSVNEQQMIPVAVQDQNVSQQEPPSGPVVEEAKKPS